MPLTKRFATACNAIQRIAVRSSRFRQIAEQFETLSNASFGIIRTGICTGPLPQTESWPGSARPEPPSKICSPHSFPSTGATRVQLELAALGVRCCLQLLDQLGQHLDRLHGLGCLCNLGLQLGGLLVALGERRAGLLVVGGAYLPERFRLLLLVFGLRVSLLPLLLVALRLRAILFTVHEDRFPYPVGKEKACSRFHVGSRLLARHEWKGQGLAR